MIFKYGQTAERQLGKYGRQTVCGEGDGWRSSPYRAVIMPLRYKNKMYAESQYTEIGVSGQDIYTYIGPARHDLTKLGPGAFLLCGGAKYMIERSEKVNIGDECVYIWAILRKAAEA